MCLLFTIIFYPVMAFSQTVPTKPLVTDRPDFTESAETVPFESLQLESGYTYTKVCKISDHSLGEFLFRIGISNKIEVRVGLNSYTWTTDPAGKLSGLVDSDLGVKIKLAKADEEFDLFKPDAAVVLMATLPTGSDEYKENYLQPIIKTAFGWDISKDFAMGTNINFSSARENGDSYTQLGASLSFGCSLSKKSGIYAEYFGFFPAGKTEKTWTI